MRPLELKAKLVDPHEDAILEEDEEEEDEDEGAFNFKVDEKNISNGKLEIEPLMNDNHLSVEQLHIAKIPPSLPTITEQSVTAAMSQKEERPKITDVFPTEQISTTEQTSECKEAEIEQEDQSCNNLNVEKASRRKSRVRTISESTTSRFQVRFFNMLLNLRPKSFTTISRHVK